MGLPGWIKDNITIKHIALVITSLVGIIIIILLIVTESIWWMSFTKDSNKAHVVILEQLQTNKNLHNNHYDRLDRQRIITTLFNNSNHEQNFDVINSLYENDTSDSVMMSDDLALYLINNDNINLNFENIYNILIHSPKYSNIIINTKYKQMIEEKYLIKQIKNEIVNNADKTYQIIEKYLYLTNMYKLDGVKIELKNTLVSDVYTKNKNNINQLLNEYNTISKLIEKINDNQLNDINIIIQNIKGVYAQNNQINEKIDIISKNILDKNNEINKMIKEYVPIHEALIRGRVVNKETENGNGWSLTTLRIDTGQQYISVTVSDDILEKKEQGDFVTMYVCDPSEVMGRGRPCLIGSIESARDNFNKQIQMKKIEYNKSINDKQELITQKNIFNNQLDDLVKQLSIILYRMQNLPGDKNEI
jgi:hypothetical protein